MVKRMNDDIGGDNECIFPTDFVTKERTNKICNQEDNRIFPSYNDGESVSSNYDIVNNEYQTVCDLFPESPFEDFDPVNKVQSNNKTSDNKDDDGFDSLLHFSVVDFNVDTFPNHDNDDNDDEIVDKGKVIEKKKQGGKTVEKNEMKQNNTNEDLMQRKREEPDTKLSKHNTFKNYYDDDVYSNTKATKLSLQMSTTNKSESLDLSSHIIRTNIQSRFSQTARKSSFNSVSSRLSFSSCSAATTLSNTSSTTSPSLNNRKGNQKDSITKEELLHDNKSRSHYSSLVLLSTGRRSVMKRTQSERNVIIRSTHKRSVASKLLSNIKPIFNRSNENVGEEEENFKNDSNGRRNTSIKNSINPRKPMTKTEKKENSKLKCNFVEHYSTIKTNTLSNDGDDNYNDKNLKLKIMGRSKYFRHHRSSPLLMSEEQEYRKRRLT